MAVINKMNCYGSFTPSAMLVIAGIIIITVNVVNWVIVDNMSTDFGDYSVVDIEVDTTKYYTDEGHYDGILGWFRGVYDTFWAVAHGAWHDLTTAIIPVLQMLTLNLPIINSLGFVGDAVKFCVLGLATMGAIDLLWF